MSTDASESSLDAGDFLRIEHSLEGQNLQLLQKGASSAKSVTLSFWVKSSVASTYTVALEDRDTASFREIGKSYTINSADTWEHKTVTFEGDTVGALDNDNAYSLGLYFWIDAGSTYTSGTFSSAWQARDTDERVYDTTGWLESTSPEFYITGIQLELGEKATPFEHRSFGDELARCKRYFERFKRSYSEMGQSSDADATLWAGCSRSGNSGNNQGVLRYTRKRNNPTVSVSSASYINSIFPISPFNSTLSGFGISGNAGIDSAFINATNSASSAPSSDCASFVYIPNNSGYLDVDAEL